MANEFPAVQANPSAIVGIVDVSDANDPTYRGQLVHLAVSRQDDGSGILKVAAGDLNVGLGGGLQVETAATYTDYENAVEDLQSGSPATVFSVAPGGRTVSIRRVLADFEAIDASNAFSMYIERTISGSTRQFTVFALSDNTKTDYLAECDVLVRPGETVKFSYNGGSGQDLWVVTTVEEV